MGSGTTLLRLILDSHERIAVPQETGFMRAARAHKFIPFWYFGGSWYKRLGWTETEFDDHLRSFYEVMFRRYAERQGKERWGEKTPWHLWHVDEMARLFPDAVFVAIVRHPGGNVASNMNRFGFSLGTSTRHYSRYNREIARQAAALGPRFLLVRYEELVLDTERVMRALLARLEEPWSERVLEHHVVHRGPADGRTVEGLTRADDPIDATRISKWENTIDESGRRVLQRRLGRLAEFFGYTVLDPAALAPLSSSGDVVLDGDDIVRRLDGFEDLDLRAAPDVPLVERAYRPRRLRLVPIDASRSGTPAAAPGGPVAQNARSRSRRHLLAVARRLRAVARRP
jgi:Sulfotransferase family